MAGSTGADPGAATVALMTGGYGIGQQQIRPGFASATTWRCSPIPTPSAASPAGARSCGTGPRGTWFWVDPARDIVFVAMIQRFVGDGGLQHIQELSRTLVQQALVDP
ncbi:MAG TPA: hypothetical protein VFK36_10730 [Gemmatimonadales bacterium]|nr:hypothetical protein [Gemmatimonadales bacterium]